MPYTPEEEAAIKREVANAFHHEDSHFAQNELSHIKHVIAVMSGKGGVGKSLVTGILATLLSRAGLKTGILDADITGPSIPRMFGLKDARIAVDPEHELMLPARSKHDIPTVSTNLVLAHESDPVLWRGPMLMGVLKQFWEEVRWGDIDCLLVDMPPGTGDVALTVFQELPIDGVIIISSPQTLVQMIVAKAVNMARQMDVPIVGLIENMSYLVCPDCGRRIEIFGPSALESCAEASGIAALGALAFDQKLAQAADTGNFEELVPDDLLPDALQAIKNLCSHTST